VTAVAFLDGAVPGLSDDDDMMMTEFTGSIMVLVSLPKAACASGS
jgi:hypothetical protein